jgi:hypothetical protein
MLEVGDGACESVGVFRPTCRPWSSSTSPPNSGSSSESTGDQARRQPDRTKATFRYAIEEWLKIHEIEDTTRQGYELYLRLHIGPALGDVPVAKLSARVLEQFYADLRRCSRSGDLRGGRAHPGGSG